MDLMLARCNTRQVEVTGGVCGSSQVAIKVYLRARRGCHYYVASRRLWLRWSTGACG